MLGGGWCPPHGQTGGQITPKCGAHSVWGLKQHGPIGWYVCRGRMNGLQCGELLMNPASLPLPQSIRGRMLECGAGLHNHLMRIWKTKGRVMYTYGLR